MSANLPWLQLFLAGLCEIGWAIGLKYTDGFNRPLPTVFTLAAMGLSFWLLAQAMRSIPLGTAYAVWTGIGAAGTVLLGIVLFGESVNAMRLGGVALVVLGILALRLAPA